MRRFLTLPVFAAALFAQGSNPFDKPPAAVDKALRERIAAFYQYHVDGQFRKADEMVAKDTKDFFYESNKPRYLSFQIQRIEYSDDYARAKAVVLCEQRIMQPGFLDTPLKVPTPSAWKREDGQWYWYVDQEAMRKTPLGELPAAPAGGMRTPPGFASMPTTPDFALKKVTADKTSLELKAGESAEIALSNAAPGVMSLELYGQPGGLEIAPALVSIPAGGKAAINVKALKPVAPVTIRLRVMQTGELIPIQVTVN